MISKQYFLTGTILLIIGSAVLSWTVVSYVDLKKAEREYIELPHDTPPGSSEPYPADSLFWERITTMTILFPVGTAFLVKWKMRSIQNKKT